MASNKSGKVHTALPRDPQRPGWVWGHVQKYLDPRPLTSGPEACLAPGGPFLLAVRGRGWVGRGEKEFLQLWEERRGEEPGLSCSQRHGEAHLGEKPGPEPAPQDQPHPDPIITGPWRNTGRALNDLEYVPNRLSTESRLSNNPKPIQVSQ